MSKFKSELTIFILTMSTAMFLLCGVDRIAVVKWDKYQQSGSTPVKHLAILQYTDRTSFKFLKTIDSTISVNDTTHSFIVPDDSIMWFALIAIDTLGRKSKLSAEDMVEVNTKRPDRPKKFRLVSIR